LKIISLSEGSFTIDKTKVFVPFDASKDKLEERPVGSLLVEIQPFLVVTEKDVLLLDVGLGYSIDGELQIHKNLQQHGFTPLDVTKVLMSHLHKDHAGGVSVEDRLSSMYSLSFPNAQYYLQQRELEFALAKGLPSYIPAELEAMRESNAQIILLEDDRGFIDDYIEYQFTGGHCPNHQVFWIRENDETIFFGGDVAPQLSQMKTKVMTKYDFDGRLSMELRQQFWEQGNQEGWTFLFYHDIANGIFPTK
jgi:glyoxylase-like metal-dependent hydrolase (beta-lactamase superfamily II)